MLLKSTQICYMCGSEAEVFCLAAAGFTENETDFNEFVHFSNITELTDPLVTILKKKAPRYYYDYTKQRGSCYFMNHCKCGTKLMDFYLHNSAGGAFLPETENKAKEIILYDIELSEKVALAATIVINDDGLIENYAKRERL